ncbi:MAG: ATP-dependent helicase [Angelakisella sp.]|nr:ATP-dependent helicase [Angelakisella sp.]
MDICSYLSNSKQISLSKQQREAVGTAGGTTLLLAVPGAGKTTVLTARIANLLANCCANPESILTLTFNRESARDMEERWNKLFGDLNLPKPSFSTIHSFCYGLLREYALLRGTQMPQLLEGENGGKSKILSDLYRHSTGQFLTDDKLSELQNAMGYCVNMCLDEQEAKCYGRGIEGFWPVMEGYTAYKRQNGLMDFDDMLLFACTALTRSQQLRNMISQRYSHILVDEAQDTSRLQHKILELLWRDNLFMVGDEDQSIYGFRGAYPQGLLDFFQRYPTGRLLKLECNYRSTGALVESSAKLIQNSKERYQKAVTTPREAGVGPMLRLRLDIEEEYEKIADSLENLPQGTTCAVLYRTTFSGILLAAILRRRGIPFFSREARLGYAADVVTRDISGILRFAHAPEDKRLFGQLYFKLGCAISKGAAAQAQEEGRGDLLQWLIDEGDWPGKNTGRLSYTRRILLGLRSKAPSQQVDDIINKLEYLHTLERKGMGGYPINGYIQKLAVIKGLAKQSKDTHSFIQNLLHAEEALNSPGNAAITLSTVHSAKGQEFDRVIIADALDGIFPQSDAVEGGALGDDRRMEEELRLFYTAMTRAKDALEIYAPATGFGSRLDPSRFLGMLLDEPTGLMSGTQVSHAYFGAGRILEVDRARNRVEVVFRTAGTKTFTMESLLDHRIFQVL